MGVRMSRRASEALGKKREGKTFPVQAESGEREIQWRRARETNGAKSRRRRVLGRAC